LCQITRKNWGVTETNGEFLRAFGISIVTKGFEEKNLSWASDNRPTFWAFIFVSK
jgi:hypothetical protein